jgi:outer membrane protease
LGTSGIRALRVRGARRAGSQAGARRSSRRFSNPFYARLWAFLLALAAVFPAFAEEEAAPPPRKGVFSDYALQFQAIGGAWLGRSEELVYRNETSAQLLSRLLWDMLPVWYLGFALEAAPDTARRRGGFFTSFSARFGIPWKSGVMRDRDWSVPEDPGFLTEFSEHTVISRTAMQAELSAGWSIPLGGALAFRPYLNGVCRSLSFSARDGYTDYQNQDDNDDYIPGRTVTPVYGEIITFSQLFWSLAPGFSIRYTGGTPGRRAFILEAVSEAGYVISYSSEDNHKKKELQFFDRANKGLILRGGISVHFLFKNRLGLRAAASYTRISGVRGSTIVRNQEAVSDDGVYVPAGSTARSRGTSGAGLSLFDVSLALTFR